MMLHPDLVIACALKKEADALRGILSLPNPIIWTGVGTQRTGSFLKAYLHRGQPEVLIFTGTAGQLDPNLPMGSVVFPEAWHLVNGETYSCHPETQAKLRAAGWNVAGLGLTVRHPIHGTRSREELFRKTGAAICDMEAAAVLAVTREFGVPTITLKVVSDTAESGIQGFWTHLEKNLGLLAERLQQLVRDLSRVAEKTRPPRPTSGCTRSRPVTTGSCPARY